MKVDQDRPSEPAAATVLQDVQSRALANLRVVVVLALALPMIAYAIVACLLYQREFAETRLRLDRSSRVAAEHALKLIDTNEMLLQRMLDLLGSRSDEELLKQGAPLHERLKQIASELPQVRGLYVFGSDSRMLSTSCTYPPVRQTVYSDQGWFKAHQRGESATCFSAQSVSRRLTGEAAFDISRRRVDGDGRFVGTVHISLRPEYLTYFYKELASADAGLRMAVLKSQNHLPLASTPLTATAPRHGVRVDGQGRPDRLPWRSRPHLQFEHRALDLFGRPVAS